MKISIIPAVSAVLFAASAVAATEVSTVDGLCAALSSSSAGAEIVLAPGTYPIGRQLSVSAQNLTLRSRGGRAQTIIEGDSTFGLLLVTNANFTAKGITFKNGHSTDGGAVKLGGDALATAKILDCDFVECTARYGGALFANDTSHSAYDARSAYGLVSGCTFTRCATEWTEWNTGGAIYGSLWVEDSVFDACDVSANASRGLTSIAATSHMTVTNCIFKGQTLRSDVRGVVGTAFDLSNHDCQDGAVRLLGCTIAGNELASSKTGLFYGSVVLDRCVVSNTTSSVNTSSTGSELPWLYKSPKRESSRISSTLFIDNHCPFRLDSVPAILNCTFVRNVGGLAYFESDTSSPEITNCVFWANIEKTSWPWNKKYKGVPGFYWYEGKSLGDSIRLANTVIEGGSANTDVTAILATDPSGESARLTALAAEKGPGFKDAAAGDWTLKRSSVMIDAGVKADWMDSSCDLTGNKRCLKKGLVSDGALPDIGCYEFFAVAGFKISLR